MSFPILTAEGQAELVARIRKGDQSAEARIAELFANGIRTMARVRTRGGLDADDVCQEVLIATITALRRGQLREAERLGPFIAGVARNVINNQLRARRNRPVEPLSGEDAAVADLRHEVERRERARMLRAALEELGTEDRRILSLTLVEGLTSADIGRRLGLNADAVRARKSRAIRRISERLRGM